MSCRRLGNPKFRPYLLGQPFKILTDHNGLTYLMTAQFPNYRLARWAPKLAEFTFTIEYRKGKLHGDADCLSRHSVDAPSPDEDNFDKLAVHVVTNDTDLVTSQATDEFCQGIQQQLKDQHPTTTRLFLLGDDGVLRGKTMTAGAIFLPVLPKATGATVFTECHDSPLTGHVGFAKTYGRLSARFYIPHIVTKVRQYVSSCRACQARNYSTTPSSGPLQPIPPGTPFEQIGIDLLGPMIRSRGMRHIIVATDYGTHYAEIAAISDANAVVAADFLLYRIVLVHGSPMRVLSDRGTNFLSEIFQELLRLVYVRQVTTTAFRPQCNGLTERLNKTLSTMLSKYVDKEKDEWAYYVPFIQFAYNTSIQASARISPYEALFGRMARLPLDTTLPLVFNRTLDIKNAIEDNQTLARAAIAESQQDAVRRNTSSNVRVYQAGDLVSVHLFTPHTGEPDKLQSNWQGPCTVLRQMSPVVYEVQTLRRRKPIDYFNVDKLKPYVSEGKRRLSQHWESLRCGHFNGSHAVAPRR